MEIEFNGIISDRCCPDCSGPYWEHPVNLYYDDGVYTCPECGCSTSAPDEDACYKDGTQYAVLIDECDGRVIACSFVGQPPIGCDLVVRIDFETFALIAKRGCKHNYDDILMLN